VFCGFACGGAIARAAFCGRQLVPAVNRPATHGQGRLAHP